MDKDKTVEVDTGNGKTRRMPWTAFSANSKLPQCNHWKLVNEQPPKTEAKTALPQHKPWRRPVILHTFPGWLVMGGLERFIFDLAAEQTKYAEVHLFLFGTSDFWDAALEKAGVIIHRYCKPGTALWQQPDKPDIERARKDLAELAPTIIHHHLPDGRWLMDECERFPLVSTKHNYATDYSRFHDSVVPICGPKAVLHGVDLQAFNPNVVNVGIVGRISAERLPDSFLAALEKFHDPQIKWWIIGRGSQYTVALEKKLNAIPHLTLRGDIAAEHMPLVYRGLDIVVNATTMDACPYNVLEAMASGCAVVARGVQGIPDVVGEAGVLCQTDAEIMAAVSSLAHDKARRQALQIAARASAETRFDLARMRADYLRIYNERTAGAFGAKHCDVEVSVVMPVHNRPEYIGDAVDSVLSQQGVTLELIIIDDGSDEPARRLVEQIAADDDRVRLIRVATNGGPGAARALGIVNARSPLVALLDSDDLMVPGRLREQIDYMGAHPDVDVLGGQMRYMDANGVLGEQTKLALPASGRVSDSAWCIANSTVCGRRPAFLAIGGFGDGQMLCEDLATWLALEKTGASFAVVDNQWCFYRQHDQQLVKTPGYLAAAPAVRMRHKNPELAAVKS